MRITGGRLRGRVVPALDRPGLRPTSARVREALFSMVGQDLAGWSVLDAFGGSGLLAFEAASRGAGPLTVVERDRRAAGRIATTARDLGVALELVRGDAARFLARARRRWDLVLLDPPYADDPALWARRAAPRVGRLLVVEHRAGEALPDRLEGLVLDRRRRYGDTVVGLFRPADFRRSRAAGGGGEARGDAEVDGS